MFTDNSIAKTSPVLSAQVKAARRMTLMGKGTLRSETESNPSLPLGFYVTKTDIDYDQFCQDFTERVLLQPGFERLRCRVENEDSFKPVSINVHDHIFNVDFDDLEEMDDNTQLTDKERKLAAFLGNWTTEMFDRSKPLWQIYLLKNYIDGKSVLAFKCHHCIGDGASISILMTQLCDPKTDVKESLTMEPDTVHKTLGDNVMDEFTVFVRFIGAALFYIWGYLVFQVKYGLAFSTPELPTQLKNQLTGKRRVAWTNTIQVSDIKTIGKRLGGTVNDILMAATAGALRRSLLESKVGEWNDANLKSLRLACPVNVRGAGDYDINDIMHNMFGFVVTKSPIDEPNRTRRLEIVTENMRAIKRTPEQRLAYESSKVLARFPPSIQKAVLKFTNGAISYISSNVQGPSTELYISGAEVEYALGVVPPPPTVGLGVAIWSYNGTLRVSFSVDEGVKFNPWDLAAKVESEIAEYYQTATAQDKKIQ
ncbi:hypothetical protein SARC_01996 [Sphaeroforma arctica JP610]|uniref:Uncharacterized protein n=1 Tax=Sphaeroforma arctica JP610 TaxID=667725 RepID=A0A0L0GA18_9EUKA|nr:hypothetical protein SARC_01996 [Sphaeroforma arctica JP610]KNC85850.1 hypothetical protein SARC_01996 [Sphaeroforma arctica JP610]|eukprot:XP_014159752.1 hypothetical protein SARC_01996 [Sphaeroforma arctica JP610]